MCDLSDLPHGPSPEEVIKRINDLCACLKDLQKVSALEAVLKDLEERVVTLSEELAALDTRAHDMAVQSFSDGLGDGYDPADGRIPC